MLVKYIVDPDQVLGKQTYGEVGGPYGEILATSYTLNLLRFGLQFVFLNYIKKFL